jgi:fumarate hydratase subunit beta
MKDVPSISLPINPVILKSLKAGDRLLLSGMVYTARDAAHQRMLEALSRKGKLPIKLDLSTLYYCGPTPAKRSEVIGSCGPTTAGRMDGFTPALMAQGLKAMIGKGGRSKTVIDTIRKYKGIYFVTYGGCGAYLNKRVKKSRLLAYADLGPEAIYELEVKDFPVIVAIDSRGKCF